MNGLHAPDSGPPRRWVLGTPLCLTTYQDLSARCRDQAGRPGTCSVDFSNTQIVTLRRHDPQFREWTRRVDYFIPDGMPLIWCLNWQRAHLPDRVYGPTFMRQFLGSAPPTQRHYLLGGSPDCLSRLETTLHRLNPDLAIVGRRHGYFAPAEEAAIVDHINEVSPDFIWVGLGTPKQQAWIHRWRDRLHHGVILAVGFAFDVNAGTKPDAPRWMQRVGLTWAFRLSSEPRRLAPRYLRWNSLFLYYLIADGVRGRAFRPPEARTPAPP